MFHVPEIYRLTRDIGPYTTQPYEGNYGAFLIDSPEPGWKLLTLASDGDNSGWEHVSVSVRRHLKGAKIDTKSRTPNWKEMCYIKSLFWDDEDLVMQLHPRKSQYVNCHPNTLHLWRPTNKEIPEPPSELVGPK